MAPSESLHRRSIALAAMLLLCTGFGGELRAQAPASPLGNAGTPALALRDSAVSLARALVGSNYVYGGESPDRGFDCSGLVRYVLAALNLSTPRTANQQARLGAPVVRDPSRLRPGDLLTFSGERGDVSHVGIYVGNGRYVHASSKAGKVIESPINRQATALVTVWQGARRLFAFIDPREDGWKLTAQRRPAIPAAKVAAGPFASIVARRPNPNAALASFFMSAVKLSPADVFRPEPVGFAVTALPPPLPDLGQLIALASPELPTVTPLLRWLESPAGSASRR